MSAGAIDLRAALARVLGDERMPPERRWDDGSENAYCTACGSSKVLLVEVTGTRDLGERETSPTGHGCEVCS